MEEGFYWVKNRYSGKTIVAEYCNKLWWTCGDEDFTPEEHLIVGPRVKPVARWGTNHDFDDAGEVQGCWHCGLPKSAHSREGGETVAKDE